MEVAVLGGGIAGLTSAYRLTQAGAQVTLFEASDRLGGLGTWFEYEDLLLDRFYHVILDSDSHLLGLLDELGMTDRLRWSETTMSFFVRGRQYPFNTPVDLLRFGALGFLDRLRTGFGALYITKLKKNGIPLDDEPAHVWLQRVFGRRVYECIWEPLLTAKFGDLRDRVPAYWIWNTLNREKDGSQEVKGYVQGGYPAIVDRLRDAIERAGGTVRLDTAVAGIEPSAHEVKLHLPEGEQRFDGAVSTLPLPALRKIWPAGSRKQVPLPDLAYQGVVNVILVRREPLDKYYWTAVVNSEFPFQGIVETTHVLPPEWIGGRHLLYLMNYCSADGTLYAKSDEDFKQDAIAGLARLYPGFDPASVEAAFVFRTPYVEPVWPQGYLQRRPPCRIDGTPVYLATTAQAYPMVTSWNTSVKLAEDATTSLLSDENRHDVRSSSHRVAPAVTVAT